MRTRVTAAALGALLMLTLAGCTTPEPTDPTPTPTPAFASEEEAFAAAEATYRAYVDAVNARREDPGAEDPQEFLIGDALAADIDTQRLLNQSGVRIVGPNALTSFEGQSASEEFDEVHAVLCVDASNSHAIDEQGTDVTPADRDVSVALDVTLVLLGDSFVISGSDVSQAHTC